MRLVLNILLGFIVAVIKLTILTIAIVAIVVTLCLSCHGQTLNLKSIPNVAHKGTLDENIYRLDTLFRIGDGITTHRNLTDKCQCLSESDPIAPHTSNPYAIAGFQAEMSSAMLEGYHLLRIHGHRRLGLAMLLTDIGFEGYTIGRNAYIQNDVDSHTPANFYFVKTGPGSVAAKQNDMGLQILFAIDLPATMTVLHLMFH